LDGKQLQIEDVDRAYSTLSQLDDPELRSNRKEDLGNLVSVADQFKADLREKIARLNIAAEESQAKQRKLDNLEESARAISRQVSSMLESTSLPSEEGTDAWTRLPQFSHLLLEVGLRHVYLFFEHREKGGLERRGGKGLRNPKF